MLQQDAYKERFEELLKDRGFAIVQADANGDYFQRRNLWTTMVTSLTCRVAGVVGIGNHRSAHFHDPEVEYSFRWIASKLEEEFGESPEFSYTHGNAVKYRAYRKMRCSLLKREGLRAYILDPEVYGIGDEFVKRRGVRNLFAGEDLAVIYDDIKLFCEDEGALRITLYDSSMRPAFERIADVLEKAFDVIVEVTEEFEESCEPEAS